MMHFKVDPTVADKIFKLVFGNEFFWDVVNLDVDVLRLVQVQEDVEIEVPEIHGGQAIVALRMSIVDEEFDKFNWVSGGGDVSGVCYVVAASSVCVVAFLGSDFADNLEVGDFPVANNWDLVILDGKEGVGASDSLAGIGTAANTLTLT
jgi:hypothetical protein